MEFLGFKITENGRQPSDMKVKAMLDFPKPIQTTDVQRFIGLTNYYRELIEGYARIAAPLVELSSSKKEFRWAEEHDEAFQELKKKLSSPPVVRIADYSKQFIVRSDACDTGMGAVLLQEIDGKRHVIAYFSKQFDPTQRRYPIIEKEATAIMAALNKWRHYLYGGQFKIETDHRPLAWLRTKTDVDGKLGRMALRLQEFERFNIDYIPGKENADADAMSRIIATVSMMPATEIDDDDQIRAKHPEWFVTGEAGRVYYVADGKKRLWIRKDQRREVIKEAHDSNLHIGVDRTLELLRPRVYWSNWTDDVKNYIRKCHRCATTKESLIEKAELAPIETDNMNALEHWSIDLLGPLPRTANNKRWIIAAQDRVTKWVEAAPLSVSDTPAITQWIMDNIVSRHGVPREISTDRGSQFESAEFKAFTEGLGAQHKLASPYHHQSNGLIERWNRTVEQLLRSAEGEEVEWDMKLPKALSTYRTTKHSTIGVSPFEALMGQQPRLDFDTKFGTEPARTASKEEIRQGVKDRLKAATRKMKKNYDQRVRARTARKLAGKRVYWREAVRKTKLKPTFSGPYIARETDNPLNYELHGRGRITKVVHVNQLKPCNNEDVPLDTLRGRGRPRTNEGGVMR